MRRTALALALLLIPAGTLPSHAQWWGGGWRPCAGFCRPWAVGGPPFARWGGPGPFWGGAPWRFGPPRYRPVGPWWNARAVRWRRFAARRRWGEEHGRPDAAAPARFGGWVWHTRPASHPSAERIPALPDPAFRTAPPRPEAAVAALPHENLRAAERHAHTPIPSRVIAAAALLRRHATAPPVPVVRAAVQVPEPPPRPNEEPRSTATVLRRPPVRIVGRAAVRPAVLRSQPIAPQPAAVTSPHDLAAPVPAASSSPVPPPATTDVPVAPLD